MSIPLLQSSMECSSNSSSSPPGRTGMTHLGLEMSSSSLVSLATGKLSISSWSVCGAGGEGAAVDRQLQSRGQTRENVLVMGRAEGLVSAFSV